MKSMTLGCNENIFYLKKKQVTSSTRRGMKTVSIFEYASETAVVSDVPVIWLKPAEGSSDTMALLDDLVFERSSLANSRT